MILGAFSELRPSFGSAGKTQPLSMNIVIQMVMLIAGACILMFCKVKQQTIPNSAVFKAGMVAIFSVFGVAWMTDSFFHAHLQVIKTNLAAVVTDYPWTYAIVLVIVSKLVNSQAAALAAVVPLGLSLGLPPKMLLAFMPMCYGYFILPTYPSDLACINFDRSGTTRIGKFIINHSFIIPGAIGITCGTLMSYMLVSIFL